MKLNNKHTGLIVASLIALSFNSHFAQAAKKTVDAVKPATAYAFKKVGSEYVQLPQVEAADIVVKKTAVKVDRNNVYIGGYIVNTTDKPIKHVRIFPTFADSSLNVAHLVEQLNHDELNIEPKETRRFVIMRPASKVAPLLAHNLPLDENCILNCLKVGEN
ncbi:MAG: hypothetical protein BWY02_01534 [bacterium ADurb.Bin157]|jgi:acyl-CoA reductase-like NAD-dependent aldehyde dehydrogenase|nr:hypothetical protein [Candidatus Riflebacteria bacterium]NCB47588.1 hypothetical protein [bacterium]OQB49366.1 MAG: hypothetical protein BWY02_01534 [bacterium ADurb.Bin157]MDD2623626.1 hypothetical protein [Candidatus Riflebacteria bacterium]MDD3376316.1 hypothetical protein [Candidatus Riflebacteria bacterium]